MSDHALALFARLLTHYPTLGAGEPEAAEMRAEDWCNVIRRNKPENAAAAVDELIECWGHQRAPRIGDYQELARRIAVQRAIPDSHSLAIEAPEVDRDRIAALIAQARKNVTEAKEHHAATDNRCPWIPQGKTDALEHMLTFEELYGEEHQHAGR